MVLEISIAGGAYADIITAGGTFVTGAYTGADLDRLREPDRRTQCLERQLRRLHRQCGHSAASGQRAERAVEVAHGVGQQRGGRGCEDR